MVSKPPANHEFIYFGAEVCLEDYEGVESIYRIVGPDEINPSKGWISMDSPMARALLKKQVTDEILVETPNGAVLFTVISIDYQSTENDSEPTI